MGNHRNTLVAVVRQELAEARGSARAVLSAAESARGDAQRRKKLIRDAYATCLAQLAEAREAARLDIVRRFTYESNTLSGSVEAMAGLCATGPAGAPWPVWAPAEPDRTGRGGLLRVGTIAYERRLLPALLPLLDAAHLSFTGDPDDADGVIGTLLLRALGTIRAGDLRLTVYDPERLGATLAAFAPLGSADLLSFVGPGSLGAVLDDLVEHISRVNETVLAGEYASVAQVTAAGTGVRPEQWRILVLLLDPASAAELTPGQRTQLDRIVRTGVACGVHLLVRGLDLEPHPTLHRVSVAAGTATCDIIGDLTITLDDPPPVDRIAAFCRSTAGELKNGPLPSCLADLEPDELWTESSAAGLSAPIGDGPDGVAISLLLDDNSPHALIGGPAGSGKTNLIYAWLGSLTARYSPTELSLYLLDFKEGMSFARFAPGPHEQSWLPHLLLAGTNLHGDREFGLAVLRHLGEELRVRSQGAKLAGRRPRIVLVIDEFPVLLAGPDAIAEEGQTLLAYLTRHGHTHGIHLILAARESTGVAGLTDQLTMRIALPRARGILAGDDLAAMLAPRHHAVVNVAAGSAGANRLVRLPDAVDRLAWRTLQRQLWRARPADAVPPRLFDGDAMPKYKTPALATEIEAVLGERIDVRAQPARLRLGRMPGRNLAVLGTRVDEACAVLATAALSLAAQGPARFSVACLDPGADRAAAELAAYLPQADCYGPDDVLKLFDVALPDGMPHYVIGYAFDAVPACRDKLQHLLTTGPELRVHVLGWWRSVARLREDLGGENARTDAIGAWVALDIQGPDLTPLSPQPGGPVWQPRPRRALFFDRSVHRTPEVIIPYEVNSDHT